MSTNTCSTGCSGSCGQGRQQCEHAPREAASACTEVGFEEADAEQSRLVTVILVIAVWCMALPAAWLFIAHIVKTIAEATP